jgi:lambda family phage portal protein
VDLAARYDAAETTAENRRHWANADFLSADAAASPDVRARLRARSRYEVANNAWAAGIVDTLTNYAVGTGPKLQIQSENADAAAQVERAWSAWAREVDLPAAIRTLRRAACESGEAFIRFDSRAHAASPVELDLTLIEADQVTTPAGTQPVQPTRVDGIEFDAAGRRAFYHVLREHPGALNRFGGATFGQFDRVPASQMLHLFRADRPGQSRGVPEITPALPLFAMLRRYTLAVLNAAERAAEIGGVIYTDAPADAGDEAGYEPEPMDEIELERGTFMTMPAGWKIGQVQAQQPTSTFDAFQVRILNEIARTLNMPLNIATGNSAKYNYASGRLDHQAWHRFLTIDRQRLEAQILDRIFLAWLDEASRITGLLPQQYRQINPPLTWQWFWPGFEHVDPLKEASAQAQRLSSNTTTLAAEFARQGLDWEREVRQRAKERALLQELGLNDPAAPASAEDEDDAEARDTENADV